MIRRQRGVALITIMLVVVVATILAVQMTNDQSVAIGRAESILDNDQVREYAYGGEELARQILYQNLKKNGAVDALSQDWASNKLHYDFDQGQINLKIEDLEGRLNLNSLASADQQRQTLAKQRFMNLFSHLGIDTAFVNRIIDWVDRNEAKLPLGAEDYDYLGLEHPYRAANRPMEDESELRLLAGMDSDTYNAIAPYVCALPDEDTDLNVNTVSARVLQAIAPALSDDQAEGIVNVRDTGKGYSQVQEFLGDPTLGIPSPVNNTGLSVQSSYFQVSVVAQYRGHFAYLTSVIERNPTDGSMRVIYRDMSRKIYPVVADDSSAGTNNG
ncbi:MAG TPA: type II secretion system minor pseudopilin GspK [Pseudomonadales bacterium]|nr:type II secretion system minor pseudopilin GspK [Pseudomonadales bacterium]